MRRWVATGGVAAASAAALVGCGSDGRLVARALTARAPGGLTSVPWTFRAADGDAVTVSFNGNDCGYTFVRTAVRETATTVAIAVYDRYRPLPAGVACNAASVIASRRVGLRAPLGGRELEHAPVPAKTCAPGEPPAHGCEPAPLGNPPGALAYRARAEAICARYNHQVAPLLRFEVPPGSLGLDFGGLPRLAARLRAPAARRLRGLQTVAPPPAFAREHARALHALTGELPLLALAARGETTTPTSRRYDALATIALEAFGRLDLPACTDPSPSP